jgi:hypothetical protein
MDVADREQRLKPEWPNAKRVVMKPSVQDQPDHANLILAHLAAKTMLIVLVMFS